MSDISGIGTVAKYLDNCDIEKLIEKIEQTKDSLLRFDSDFGEEYFKLLKDCIDKLDKDGNEEQYLTQYGIYEKDYWNALAAMLEKNEGILNDELKEQLAVARAMAGYYNTTDEIGSKDTSSERMVELLEERKKYEKQLLKLNKNYTDEELENAISELDNKYGRLVLGVKYNSVQERLTKLSVDDEGYKEKCLALLKEGNEYEKELLKGLPEDEYNKQLKLLENDYQKKILLVESSVIENEFSKLNVDDKDYSTKYLALLDRQKETAQSLLKLDGSLTSEELNTKLELIDSQYKYSRLITENNKIESDLNGLDIESDDYNEQVLSLLKQQRGCMEELLRMNNSLTEEQISAQLSLLDQNIYQAEQNVEWDKTNFVEKGIQYTGTFLASTACGIIDVGESIYDGLAMIEGKLLNDEQTAADIVKTDVSEEFYSAWMKNLGVNDNAAYSKVHDVGNFVGNAAGYALLSAVPGGAAVTGTLGFLAASGSASERALNNGASYDQALLVGLGSGAIGAATGVWSNNFGEELKNKLYDSLLDVGIDALKGAIIGTVEPLFNTALEYSVYAKDLKDENGELLYKNDFDYYTKSGALINIATGFASGFLTTGFRGVRKYNEDMQSYINKVKAENKLSNETLYYELSAPERGVFQLDPNKSAFEQESEFQMSDPYLDYGVRAKVDINSEVRENALLSFSNAMNEGRQSDSQSVEILYNIFKEQMENGNEEALKVMNKITELKKKNPELHIETSNEGSYWRDSEKMVNLNATMVSANATNGIVCHEFGHAIFDLQLDGKMPDNWDEIVLNAQNNVENGGWYKIKNHIKHETLINMGLYNKSFEEIIPPGLTRKQLEYQLTMQYSKMFEGTPQQIADTLEKAGYNSETITAILKGEINVTSREIAKQSINNSVNQLCEIKMRKQFNSLYAVSDIIDAVYKGDIFEQYHTSGHGKEYYIKGEPNFQIHEIMANFTELKVVGSDKKLYTIKRIFGDDFYNALNEIYENMVKSD